MWRLFGYSEDVGEVEITTLAKPTGTLLVASDYQNSNSKFLAFLLETS